MSINNFSKSEIIDQLQMSEYYRDALHFGVKEIGMILNVDDSVSRTDEELITIVLNEFINLVTSLPDNIKVKLNHKE
jgi:hypothetical protein|tara:strand:- start:5981 stop:6211 length:231 start_codon:yes stop_codon:yes gene_type:complete